MIRTSQYETPMMLSCVKCSGNTPASSSNHDGFVFSKRPPISPSIRDTSSDNGNLFPEPFFSPASSFYTFFTLWSTLNVVNRVYSEGKLGPKTAEEPEGEIIVANPRLPIVADGTGARPAVILMPSAPHGP